MSDLTLQEQLMTRSIKDPVFRQELLSNPKKVLASEYQVQLPEHVTVRVLEEAPDTLSIMLPPAEDAVQELSDEDLETATGGTIITTILLTTILFRKC